MLYPTGPMVQGNFIVADDRHYVGGEFYRICDRTGFKIRDTRTRKEWNNFIVREGSWEPRQPQDFVQGIADDQSVPDARPRSLNTFIGPLTTVTTLPLVIGAAVVHLETSLRMLNGDVLWIMMDNGVTMVTHIVSVLTTTTVQISPAMVWSAATNSQVTDVTAETVPTL